MGALDILSILSTLLSGLNTQTIQDQVTNWLTTQGEKYPDLRQRTDALASWLTAVLTDIEPNLDPIAMKDTVWGIASDIVHGTAGVDPSSWIGAG